MNKSFYKNVIFQFSFLSIVVFLSRLPFLWAGFGAEEDSWLLAITAKNMALSGNYEMSRAPGHPLQEYLYAFLFNNGLNPFYTNLISAISSVITTVFFALSVRQLGLKHYLFAGFAFAFTPIVFISSTYTIDYMLAMAFVMGSFYFITKPAASPPSKGGQGDWLLSPPPLKERGPGGAVAVSPPPLKERGPGGAVAVSPPPLKERGPGGAVAVSPPLPEERGLGGEVAAGIFLGLAIGFRLTSIAMLIPFCIWLFPPYQGITVGWKHRSRGIGLFASATLLVGLLTYLPVLKTYGLSFFHYSDQFPYPNLPKVFYKLTLGTFGTIGLITILFWKVKILFAKFRMKEKMITSKIPAKLFWASVSVIVLYLISYLRLPQKSAYLIPAVPFIILMFGYYLSARSFKIFCVLLSMSSFLFSINLTDSLRGSTHSALSVKFRVAGQEIFIDPLTGPVFSDYTKRLNKITYTEEVFQKVKQEQKKIVLICGWWYNELLVRGWNVTQNPNVVPVFYIDKPSIEKYASKGYIIYYLPEQNLYNDQYSQMNYTDSVARPYM
ncbi:MAG: hypothetical protein EPN85_11765 [Bacteroidetes bacterium]|nr:MAG: hypothetical protein EPN85_11765 [Bacteroidota bacterium]